MAEALHELRAKENVRWRALQFAAGLRGARDDSDVLSWAVEQGYAETMLGEETSYRLTDAGRDRADEIIRGDPAMFGG